jgi:hypothetical protein
MVRCVGFVGFSLPVTMFVAVIAVLIATIGVISVVLTVMGNVGIVVPVISNKVDRLAAGVVLTVSAFTIFALGLRTVPSPEFRASDTLQRPDQISRRYRSRLPRSADLK